MADPQKGLLRTPKSKMVSFLVVVCIFTFVYFLLIPSGRIRSKVFLNFKKLIPGHPWSNMEVNVRNVPVEEGNRIKTTIAESNMPSAQTDTVTRGSANVQGTDVSFTTKKGLPKTDQDVKGKGKSEQRNRSNHSIEQRLIWETTPLPIRPECLAKIAIEGPKRLPNFQEDVDFLQTEEGKQYKKILAWHYAYGHPINFYGRGHKSFHHDCCKEPRCFFTATRNDPRLPIREFDAIIIQFRGSRYSDLPKERSDHQRWIFVENESPAYSYANPDIYNGLFNWTMTNRLDSDIYRASDFVFPKRILFGNNKTMYEESERKITPKLREKKKMAAWFVSHCSTSSRREVLVKKLQKYISVDIYGGCGKLKCPRSTEKKCYEMVERNYKFYLSFENSICKGYITEKFFNILKYNVVPVVYGYGVYEDVAPPHSYINVKDFKSVMALAEYLIYLNSNDSAYNEYFAWKKNYVVLRSRGMSFCELCSRLHSKSERKTYQAMNKWFKEDAHCQTTFNFT